MINLLPPEEKKKLVLKRQERLVSVLGIVAAVSLICLILILLAIKYYVLSEADFQKGDLEQEIVSSGTSDVAEFSQIIEKYNGLLFEIDSFYNREIYFSQVLDVILSIKKPDGVKIDSFYLERSSEGTVKVELSGTSDSRENLISFRENVEADEQILNPTFSAQSWINPKNVEFSLIFEISQNEDSQ